MPNIGSRPIRIAIGAGHRNTVVNGNPDERAMNGLKVRALVDHLDTMPKSIEYYCYTPNRGLGLYPGTYNDAAFSIVRHSSQTGWIPDIFLEIHSQGVGNTSVRGAFSIYPDERHIAGGNDIDIDVREHGAVFAREHEKRTGIPLYPPQSIDGVRGIMSEQETGVGRDGYRLGVFAVTESLKAATSRLIFESGTHSNPEDWRIMNEPGYLQRFAEATSAAIMHFAISAHGWNPADDVYPDPERTLRQKLGDKNYIPHEGARVYRFIDEVMFHGEIPPHLYADVNSPAVAKNREPFERFRVAAIIAKKSGEKWFLGTDDARYLITGNEMTVL